MFRFVRKSKLRRFLCLWLHRLLWLFRYLRQFLRHRLRFLFRELLCIR